MSLSSSTRHFHSLFALFAVAAVLASSSACIFDGPTADCPLPEPTCATGTSYSVSNCACIPIVTPEAPTPDASDDSEAPDAGEAMDAMDASDAMDAARAADATAIDASEDGPG